MLNQGGRKAVLENHYYGSNGAAIKYTTRNICSDATAKTLQELAGIFFFSHEVEVYVLPAKDGCHQDTFLVQLKNGVNSPAALVVIPVILTAMLGWRLSESTIRVNNSQDELNRLQIEKLLEEVNNKDLGFTVTEAQCQSVIENRTIKKQLSRHFEQLKADEDIVREKVIATSNEAEPISEVLIDSISFSDYIDQDSAVTELKTIEKIHELTVIQPVNEREHKNLSWNVEDVNKKEKFGVYMEDESFYEFYLENVIGLKTIIAKIRYTIEEDANGDQSFKKKEVITVYKYNDVQRIPFEEDESLSVAPIILANTSNADLTTISRETATQCIAVENNMSLFPEDSA